MTLFIPPNQTCKGSQYRGIHGYHIPN